MLGAYETYHAYVILVEVHCDTLSSQINVPRRLIFQAFVSIFLPNFDHKNACKILICERIFKIQTSMEG